MTDQKDLFNADEQQDEKITGAESLSPAPAAEEPATEAVEDIAGRGIAAGEVRTVELPPKQKSSTPLVAILLVLLFWGSSNFSESISASKYPGYKDYQKKVGRFIPRPVTRDL